MSSGRDSRSAARESAPSSLQRRRKPKRRQSTVLPHGLAPSTLDNVCFQLLEARSIFACAARCLDEKRTCCTRDALLHICKCPSADCWSRRLVETITNSQVD